MAQDPFDPLDGSTDEGPDLVADVNAKMDALTSMHSGTSVPPGVVEGQQWLDTSAGSSAYVIKLRTGGADLKLFDVDSAGGSVAANTGRVLLHEDSHITSASATPLVVASTVTDLNRTRELELIGIGNSGTHTVYLEVASDTGGGSWYSLSSSEVIQNAVVGTSHDRTPTFSGGAVALNNGQGGWVSGALRQSFSIGGGTTNTIAFSTIRSPVANVDMRMTIGPGLLGVYDSFRISCSTAFFGIVRYWELPAD